MTRTPTSIDRARAYLEKIPGAVSGQGGHNQTFAAACALVHGFALSEHDAFALLCRQAKHDPQITLLTPTRQFSIERRLSCLQTIPVARGSLP